MYIAKKQPKYRKDRQLFQSWVNKDLLNRFYVVCQQANVSRQDMLEWAIKMVLKDYEIEEGEPE